MILKEKGHQWTEKPDVCLFFVKIHFIYFTRKYLGHMIEYFKDKRKNMYIFTTL